MSRGTERGRAWTLVAVALALLPLPLLAPALFGERAFSGLHTGVLSPWRESLDPSLAAEARRSSLDLLADKTLQSGPLLQASLERARAGEAPLWNPDNLAGVPLLAQGFPAVFHPPVWLLAWLPPGRAFAWVAWLQAVLAGLLMASLLRLLGLLPLPAFLGGATYMLSGYLSARWHWYMIHGCSLYLPWVLLGIERLYRGGRAGSMASTGLAVGLACLTGWLQGALHLLYAAGAWAAVRLVQGLRGDRQTSRAALAASVRAAAAVVLGLALGWAQVGPTLEYVLSGESARAEVGPASLQALAMSPNGLAALVVPDLFGHPRDLADHPLPHLRHRGVLARLFLRPGDNAVETASSLGLASLVLALLGLGARRHGRGLALAFLLAGLLLAIDTPLLLLAARLPGLATGDPHRFLLFVSLGGALLAGFGLQRLLAGGNSPSLRRVVTTLLVAAALATLSAWRWSSAAWADFVSAPLADSFGVSASEVRAHTHGLSYDLELLRWALARLTALLLACSLGLHLAARRPRLGAALLVSAALLDLGSSSARFATTVPAAGLDIPPPGLPALLDDGGGRLVRFHPGGADALLEVPLPPNTGLPFGVRDLGGYWALAPRRIVDVLELIEAGSTHELGLAALSQAEALSSPLLDALAVTRVLSSVPLEHDGLQARGRVGEAWLYGRPSALPRAYLSRPLPVDDAAEALAHLSRPDFDPRLATLVEPTPDGVPAPRFEGPPTSDGAGSLRWLRDDPEAIALQLTLPATTLLVLADTWMPGWSASIDGRPTPVWPANHLGRAVRVEAGVHRVDFRYASPAWEAGRLSAPLAGLALLGLALLARRRRHDIQPTPAATADR